MTMRLATCHPDQKHRARGLCARCYIRTWCSENREKRRAIANRWAAKAYAADRDTYRDRHRAWRKANPEWSRADNARRRASTRTHTEGAPTSAQLAELLAPGVRCFYCEGALATTIDHFVPLSRGGAHAIGNLVPACLPCNSSKGAKLPDVEWRGRGKP